MKKAILIGFMCFSLNYLYSQNNSQAIYEIKNNTIVVNDQFIYNPIGSLFGLAFSTSKIGEVNVGEEKYEVRVGRFNGWKNEPGDFDVIQFFKDSQHVLTFKSQDGIVRLNNPQNLYAYEFYQYGQPTYYIEHKLSENSKAILFLGQHYGTDLATLIIFVVAQNQVKLVFCRKMQINSIISTSNSFSMTLQSTIVEDGHGTTHTIWEQDGVLWFKNN